MNKLIELESTEECKFCFQSNILMSSSNSSSSTLSNFKDKQYLLYFQNDNLSLFEGDDIGISIIDELIIKYCPMCGRELLD